MDRNIDKNATFILGFQADLALGDSLTPILLILSDQQLYLVVNNIHFAFSSISNDNISGFIASYKSKIGEKIDLGKVIGELIPSIANYLPSINLNLKNIFVAYQKQNKNLESEKGKASTVLIGASLDFKINLADLPLIGAKIPPEYSLSLENFQTLYISQEINPKTFDSQILKAANLQGVNQETLPQGLTMSAQLKIGQAQPQLFTISIGGKSNPEEQKEMQSKPEDKSDKSSAPTKKAFEPNAIDRSIFWMDLNKTLGPVTVQQIGVQYQNSELWFFLNASLSFQGITLACNNLGVGSSLKEFKPRFRLDGLSIHYKSGDTLEIGGAFLRKILALQDAKGNIIKDKDGKIETYDEYSGAVILAIKIKGKKLTFAAIGSYTEVAGRSSLFIYVFVGLPLGGPPAFFVTGLAAGFGYNRTLKAPNIDNVADFPLVKLAVGSDDLGKDLLTVLKDLGEYIPPSPGEMFLAIGIKFTSFKIIDAFVLLIVKFGRRLEIYILGLAHLIAPPQIAENIPILAEAKLAIKATYIPDEGFLAIEARLTEGSYILAKNCKLSGGFAFYTWFSGEHQGDFVLTLGGYHPLFKIPAHYPQVAPVQISWKLNDYLSLQGSIYFALLPSNLMVGGIMEAAFSKGNVVAWFKIEVHFIVAWQPFYYVADVSLELRVLMRINVGCISTSLSLNLGGKMRVWGPPFSGIAALKLAGDISLQIEFGNINQQKPEPLSWEIFQKSLLPAPTQISTISVGSGLIGKVSKDKIEEWIINPKELLIITDSAVPSSQLQIGNEIRNQFVNLTDLKYIEVDHQREIIPFYKKLPNNSEFKQIIDRDTKKLEKTGQIGIRPMEIKPDNLEITYQVEITRDNQHVEADFSYTPVLKGATIALWGKGDSYLPDNPNEEKFIPDVLFGLEIRPAEPPLAGASENIAYEKLLFDFKNVDNSQWNKWETIKNINISPEVTSPESKINFNEENPLRDRILKAFKFEPKQHFTIGKSEQPLSDDLLGNPKVISL